MIDSVSNEASAYENEVRRQYRTQHAALAPIIDAM